MNLNVPMAGCTLQWRHFVQKAFFNGKNMHLNRGSQLFFSSCAHFSFTKIIPEHTQNSQGKRYKKGKQSTGNVREVYQPSFLIYGILWQEGGLFFIIHLLRLC